MLKAFVVAGLLGFVAIVQRDYYKRVKNISYNGKEVAFMDYFLAVNDKQLGICLRMLYAEKIRGFVETVMNEKGKIEFHISIAASPDMFEELRERYQILIS